MRVGKKISVYYSVADIRSPPKVHTGDFTWKVLVMLVEVLRQLLSRTDIQVNLATHKGKTPLHMACQEGYVDVVRQLLSRTYIQVNLADQYGRTPLQMAMPKWCIFLDLIKNLAVQIFSCHSLVLPFFVPYQAMQRHGGDTRPMTLPSVGEQSIRMTWGGRSSGSGSSLASVKYVRIHPLKCLLKGIASLSSYI